MQIIMYSIEHISLAVNANLVKNPLIEPNLTSFNH